MTTWLKLALRGRRGEGEKKKGEERGEKGAKDGRGKMEAKENMVGLR
jgi:hypothetical protein